MKNKAVISLTDSCPRCLATNSLFVYDENVVTAVTEAIRHLLSHFRSVGQCKEVYTPSVLPYAPFIQGKNQELLLRTLFRTIVASSNGCSNRLSNLGMDLETFSRIFPQLPGVVGDRLFAAFDTDQNGFVNFAEFYEGLRILTSYNLNEKLKMIFNMYGASKFPDT